MVGVSRSPPSVTMPAAPRTMSRVIRMTPPVAADAQHVPPDAPPPAAADGQRHRAPRDAAAALQEEDEFGVQPASPSFEVADLEARVARIDRAAARSLDLDEDARVEGELLGGVE